jgi:hypothetical protein
MKFVDCSKGIFYEVWPNTFFPIGITLQDSYSCNKMCFYLTKTTCIGKIPIGSKSCTNHLQILWIKGALIISHGQKYTLWMPRKRRPVPLPCDYVRLRQSALDPASVRPLRLPVPHHRRWESSGKAQGAPSWARDLGVQWWRFILVVAVVRDQRVCVVRIFATMRNLLGDLVFVVAVSMWG